MQPIPMQHLPLLSEKIIMCDVSWLENSHRIHHFARRLQLRKILEAADLSKTYNHQRHTVRFSLLFQGWSNLSKSCSHQKHPLRFLSLSAGCPTLSKSCSQQRHSFQKTSDPEGMSKSSKSCSRQRRHPLCILWDGQSCQRAAANKGALPNLGHRCRYA